MVEALPNLIDELRASHALEPAELHVVERELLPHCSDARGLCKTLIARGWLTTLQAHHLLEGKGKELFLDPYVLLEHLGEGGMGEVYKARHTKLGRIVALKLIRKGELKDNRLVARFRREIATIAQLSHPNIVTAYDADHVGDLYFYSMEFVDGRDLTRLVREKGPLSVRRACDYIRQAALALTHASALGMVHRDVKPSNLLVTADGSTVKLLDLGLARMREGAVYDESLTNVTQIGTFVGTPDFVAPEQAVNPREVDIRADLYSLGCTFYFLLTGEPPFAGESTMEKLIKHRTEEPIRLETVRPDVPRAVAAIQRKLMAKRPEDRYQTPEELATALEPFCGLAAQARRASPAPIRRPKHISPIAPIRLPPAKTAEETSDGPTPHSESVGDAAAEAERQVGELPHTGLAFALPRRRPKRRELLRWGIAGAATLALFAGMLLVLANLVSSDPAANPQLEEKRTPTKSEMKRPTARTGWLDQLDPSKLADDVREAWRAEGGVPPVELVAVVGTHRWRHWGTVRSLAIDPTDNLVASAGDDGVVRIWQLETGKPLLRINGHLGSVRAVAFSHDGRLLASAGDDGVIRLWSTAKWELVSTLEPHAGTVRCLAFPPTHSALLASGGEDGAVRAWSLPDGRGVATLETQAGPVCALAFAATGRQLAAGTEQGRLKIWEIESRKETLSVATRSQSPISGVAFGPGDRTVVTSDLDGKVFLWITGRPQARALLNDAGPMHCLAPLPSGRRQEFGFAAGGADGDLNVMHPERKAGAQLVQSYSAIRLKGHAAGITALAVGHRQQVLVSGDHGGAIRVWNLDDGQERFKVAGPQGPVRAVAFGPEGRTLALAGGDRIARLWDFASRRELEFQGHTDGLTGVVLSQQLVTTSEDRTLRLWDVISGREKKTLTGHDERVLCVAGSADGKLLASGDAGGVIRLWDAVTGNELAKLVKHRDKVTALTFAPDGKLLLSGCWNGEIVLWDVLKRELRVGLRVSSYEVLALAFAPDGKAFASAGADKGVHFWDPLTGKPFNKLELDAPVLALRYAPDGKRVAFSTSDGLVAVCDLAGRRVAEWRLFGPVLDLAFAPDGRHLATANANGTVYLFRLSPLASGSQ